MTKFYKKNLKEFSRGSHNNEGLLRFAENIIENSNNIFYEHDLEGNLIFISKQIEEIVGYSSEGSNLNWQQLLTENPKNEIAYSSRRKAFETGKRQPAYEVEIYSKSGSKLWLEIREAPVFENGIVCSIAGEAIDISERKRIEEALLESEKNFRLLVENQKEVIAKFDLEGRLTYVSPNYCKVFDVKYENIIGKRYIPEVHPDDLVEFNNMLEKSISDPYDVNHKERMMTVNGWRWFSWCNKAIIENDGSVKEIITVGRDIDQLKLSENELANARKFNDNLIDTANVMIVGLNLDGTVKLFNPKAEEVTGYTAEELKSKNWFDIMIPSEQKEEVKNRFNEVFKSNLRKISENSIVTKSGEEKIISWNNSEIKSSGKLIGTLSFGIDITENKKAEHDLRISEEKFAKAFLASPDSITLSSIKEGLLLEINNGFEKIFGYSRDFALGKTTVELGLWKDINARDECVNLLKTQGYVKDYVSEYNAKNGRNGTAEVSMELITIRDNDYLLTIVRDITERIKIESRLIASEEKFSAAFYASPDANVISRMKDGVILDINPVFEKLFEYGREEVIGKTTDQLKIYKNPNDKLKIFDLLHKDGVIRNLTVEYKTRSGKTGFTQLSIDQLMIAGELCLISSIRDITEQIKSQKAIEDYQKKLKSLTNEITLAEERERRKIAMNLHDHLSQSLAMSKIRLAEAKKQKSEEEIICKIKEARKFLDNAIIKSRSITYELSPPVLYDLGFSAAIRWQLDVVAKEHKIETELEDTADIITLNDEVRVLLFRAVVEIINNALKHADASKLTIKINNDKNNLFVEVTDDGIGFDQQAAELNASKNNSFGIFSMRERISYIKGTMVIDSEMNKGTSVKIAIPYKN
ncbi:MAG: PAS domain S-box protein [Ignavibacteriae bacterium]|nr:PAS domain S-box protein [Ignavibacteriota bacterium]NOG97297.1 PAS domain S-box protein [Ignavibacteriota bacterium]